MATDSASVSLIVQFGEAVIVEETSKIKEDVDPSFFITSKNCA